MSHDQAQRSRDYGGWRRRRGIGLWGLGTGGTFTALAALMAVIVVAAADPAVLIYVAPPLAVAAALGLARINGEPLALKAVRRVRWWHGTRRNYTKYRAGVVRELPTAFQLPGVLAPATLVDAEDGYGGRYGVVWDRRTGLLTPTLRVVPTSTWLADRADADTWVASWGGWLSSLGFIPMLRWVTVTIDTAPDPGSTLADQVSAATDPSAPAAARAILADLVAAAPAAAADVDTRVSLTFDPKASAAAPKNLTAALAEVGRTLFGLETALGTCGLTVLGRLTSAEIAGVVRTAFDPAARGEVSRVLAPARRHHGQLGWADAGPVGADEQPGHYRHDSGVSVTWAWQEAPRQNVTADVLARLVAPGPYPKRVSLQCRPFPAAQAAKVLESEVNAATFREHYRRRTGRDATARDAADQARARQAAAEEAMGAGVCLMSLFVTVTVLDPERLPHAVAATEAAAESSKIRLRRMTYSQAAGFAATLPCGICPADLARRIPH
jgi:hypothetical protein